MSKICETERETNRRLLRSCVCCLRGGNPRALLTPEILHLRRESFADCGLLLQYEGKTLGYGLRALCRTAGGHLSLSTKAIELSFSSTAVKVQGLASSSCLFFQYTPLSPGLLYLDRPSASIAEGALLLIQHFLLLLRQHSLQSLLLVHLQPLLQSILRLLVASTGCEVSRCPSRRCRRSATRQR